MCEASASGSHTHVQSHTQYSNTINHNKATQSRPPMIGGMERCAGRNGMFVTQGNDGAGGVNEHIFRCGSTTVRTLMTVDLMFLSTAPEHLWSELNS
mmetsp:Transcript_12560/g.24550  ORF Transcript_12560/g.24550 Transcript_12560/m.24550 type:complete len:97 (+) Transcript_12560:1177-1467(+)